MKCRCLVGPVGHFLWFRSGPKLIIIGDPFFCCRIQIYLLAKQLSLLDKVPLKSPNLERISSYFYEHYEVRIFTGDNRLNIGEFKKSKRVCRFCGRSMPKITFMQKAHAISESLGNKGLICREECDDYERCLFHILLFPVGKSRKTVLLF